MGTILLLFGTFFAMCLIGVPVAMSLGISALISGLHVGITPIVMCQQIYAQLDSFTLLAIPLFLLVGNIMDRGQITDRLVGFASKLVGHITGGLGHVNVVANMIMAGISGSATADAAALGGIMIPSMRKAGYTPEMAAAINASAATIAPIIPPSIMMVTYGAFGSVSIAALFMGGIVPGVLVGLTIMIVTYIWAKKHKCVAVQKRATLREVWDATKRAFTALLVPLIIILGVLSGIFTATESGMIAVVYSLFLVMFVYRTCTWKEMAEVFMKSCVESAKPLLCVGGAGAFGYMMAYLQIPQMMLDAAGPIVGKQIPTLLFITFLYIILGTFMDSIPAIIIFLPIVQQMGTAAGIDPIHMGVLVTVVLCFGLLTPPYGMTLLLSAGLAGVPTVSVIKELKYFYLVYLLVILGMIFIPQTVLFLPNLLT